MMNTKRNLALGLAVATLAWNDTNVLGQPTGVLPEQLNPAQQRMMLSVSARHQLMTFSRVHALRARLILPKDAPIWELWVNDWTHSRRVPTSSAPAPARVVTSDDRASDSWKYVFTFNGHVAAAYSGGAALADSNAVTCDIALCQRTAESRDTASRCSRLQVLEVCLDSLPAEAEVSATQIAASQWSPDVRTSEVMVAFNPDVAPLLPGGSTAPPAVAAGPKK